MEWFQWLWEFIRSDHWISLVTAIITITTVITAVFPSTADNPFLNLLLKILNFLAGNVHKNKNADAN